MNKLNDAKQFILAGQAIFTVHNISTGGRFTYKSKKCENKEIWFISSLYGPDNYLSYKYIGSIFGNQFRSTKKSIKDKSFVAFDWIWKHIEKLPNNVEIIHEGKCGRCGKRLTVPESIKSGFGPECITKI